eukprot:TRINITY_DN27926_c0_g1_i1.p1 TRINITY_DN27926_c0_g1~~TRINITY_DN27926_c0_g1_i1.p1  ORF type:complete len:983 (+),score=121.11 TRINITY_DN27926_c0_g1_i1:82-3030(+)
MSGSTVLRAIQEASSPTSPYRKEADDWLQAFIKCDDGWMLMGWIGSDVEETVQFFACHAMKLKIAADYESLHPDYRNQVWDQLISKTQVLHTLPRAATLQFCWAVAKACPYHGCPGVQRLLQNGYVDNLFTFILEILHNVGDDAHRVMCDATEFDKNTKVTHDQIDEGDLKNVEDEPLPVDTNPLVIAARASAPQVVSWLSSAVEAHPEAVNRINSCYAMWVPFIPAKQISSCVITTQCLNNILRPEYTDSSADVWIAISRFCTHEVAAEMYGILPPTVLKSDSLAGVSDQVRNSVSRAVCAIGKANAKNFVHQLRQESVRSSLHIFSELIGSADDEVSAAASAVLAATVSHMENMVRDVPIFHEIIPTILNNIYPRIKLSPTKQKNESREQDEERCELYRDCVRLSSRVASDTAMSHALEMLRSVMAIAGSQKRWDFVTLEGTLAILFWITFPMAVTIAGVDSQQTQLLNYIKRIVYSFPFEDLHKKDTTAMLLETIAKLLVKSPDMSTFLKQHATGEQIITVVDIVAGAYKADPTIYTARCVRNLCMICSRKFLQLGSNKACPPTPSRGTTISEILSTSTPVRQVRPRGNYSSTPTRLTPGAGAVVITDFEYTQEYLDLEQKLCSLLVVSVRHQKSEADIILQIGQGVAEVIQLPLLHSSASSGNFETLISALISDCLEGSVNACTGLGAVLRVATNLCNFTYVNSTLLVDTWMSFVPSILNVIAAILVTPVPSRDEVLSAGGLIIKGLMGSLRMKISHNLSDIFKAIINSLRLKISASMYSVLGEAVHTYRVNSEVAPLLKQTTLEAVAIAKNDSNVILRSPDVAAGFFSLLRFAVLVPFKPGEVNFVSDLLEEESITDWLHITSTVLHSDILSVPSLRVIVRFLSTIVITKFIKNNIDLVLTIILRTAITKPVDVVRTLGYAYEKFQPMLKEAHMVTSLHNVRCPEALVPTLLNELLDPDPCTAMIKFHYASKQLKQN